MQCRCGDAAKAHQTWWYCFSSKHVKATSTQLGATLDEMKRGWEWQSQKHAWGNLRYLSRCGVFTGRWASPVQGMSQLFILKHADNTKCNGDCVLCRYGMRENDIVTGWFLCIKPSEQHCRPVREVVLRMLHLVSYGIFLCLSPCFNTGSLWTPLNCGSVFLHLQFVSVCVRVRMYRIDRETYLSLPAPLI
jgi:hypothetical protein